MTDDTDDAEFSVEQREEAYRHIKEARASLSRAAVALGAEDVHDLADTAPGGGLDHQTDEAITAITNAHSYLNNGAVEMLLYATEEYERDI
jgi:hydroxypyruvate isomerase